MPDETLKSPASLRGFRRRLLTWYRFHKRPLPWRRTRNPYRIWVSEIMLQQTRVNAAIEHYKRFLKSFPTVRSLASAEEADVLTVWSGLGYYRRARMLHRAAKLVAAQPSAAIPRTADRLRELPGIGRYTANAIASIAFGEAVAVVDGNVERVLSRLFAGKVSGERLWCTAQTLLDLESPGDFNQAMMELGATICLPGAPLCHLCPVHGECASRGSEREKVTLPEKRSKRSASVLLVRRRSAILLRHRSAGERLMPAMWELPEAQRTTSREPLLKVKHSITTNDWQVSVFSGNGQQAGTGEQWVPLAHICQIPLTGLTRKILSKLNLLS